MRFIVGYNKRFEHLGLRCVESIIQAGYQHRVYNLGGLDYGIPFEVRDEHFQSTGCYQTHFKRWRSRAMHVVGMVKHALDSGPKDGSVLAYLDADTELLQRVDEIDDIEFDVALTERHNPEEIKVNKRCNTGVMFFRWSPATMSLLRQWKKDTIALGTSQEGMNMTVTRTDANVAYLPCRIYNNYYDDKAGAKILHQRASITDR